VPEDALGKIIGDLSSRRGRVQGMEANGTLQLVTAEVPARELHHYATVLRSLTGGRSVHSEEFSHYEEMPRELEAKVIAEAKAEKQHHH
jgi:elongation factor G